VNDMGDLSWYLRWCAFERVKVEGVMKMIRWLKHFDIQCETQTPTFVEFDLEPKRSDEKEDD